ncbi:hypothetical protein [Rufibacter hautae]|uniref:Uncharacterized protein n=1 Tax=Rufibacter hautae TaxID=2595005 RepID=A0A5B6TJ13_9BACT|nr:hypothetical protein [Rufibacter hautae]KAA3440401.1 hypothetical protein FOA19_07045 [Rufibacter hautae]
MKTFFSSVLLLSVLLVQTACMRAYEPIASSDRLSSLPTPGHSQEVEVFFPGERPTDTAYVKIAVVEEKAEGEVAYAKLVEQLRNKAQKQGLDAILILGKTQGTQLKNDATLFEVILEIASGDEIKDNYYSVTTHELSAVGIKYKRNLQYLPQYVQSKRLYALEQGQELLLATVAVDHLGQDQKVTYQNVNDTPTYQGFVHRYSLDHLLKEQGPKWHYLEENGLVVRRKLMSLDGSGPIKNIKISYNAAQLPEKLEIRHPVMAQPEILTITYNAQGQVTQKLIYRNKQLVLQETNTYDAAGKLVSTLHEKVQHGAVLPFLKTVYDYYNLLSLN